MTDFEQLIRKAIFNIYRNLYLEYGYFHHSKAIWKKTQNYDSRNQNK